MRVKSEFYERRMIRKSTRYRNDWVKDEQPRVMLLAQTPRDYDEAINSADANNYKDRMDDDVKSHHDNGT